MENDLSYFPLKIRLIATGEEIVCKTDHDVPRGISFRVLELRSGTHKIATVFDEFPDVQKPQVQKPQIEASDIVV